MKATHFALLGILALTCPLAAETETPTLSVGMSGTLESVVLPGPALEAVPLTDPKTALVLRIVNRYPHGDSFRYDFEFYGLEPGPYDLIDYLQPEGEAEPVDLPALLIEVKSTLPEEQILPNALEATSPPKLGGYRMALLIGGILWLLVMAWILFWKKSRNTEEEVSVEKPLSTADRLQPLLASAMTGTIEDEDRALLERLLLDHWRKKLELDPADPLEGMKAIRDHDEAGILVRRMEDWLHRPDQSFSDDDITELLKPYQNDNAVSAAMS
ncbi:MAG: hypothetical protein AAGF67_06915 [Verrucomicrobiota bacterium]